MPGFHHSVAVLPFRSKLAEDISLFSFVAVASENGNAGNVFLYTYIVTF